ncbi:hypothetical protein D9M72_644070 [compost metagenome]
MAVGRFKIALGLQDQFAELASGTFAAARQGHPMSVLANEGGGVGHRHAQPDPSDHGQVRQVVAQIRNLFIA